MLCIKGMDLDVASIISGVSRESNARAREFATHIRDNYQHIRLSLRWVLLEDITDTDKEIEALAEFAKDLNPVFTHVELLPYHTLGKEKWEMIGVDCPFGDMEPYEHDSAVKVQEKLLRMGIPTTLYSNIT
mmetsp:Transcript_28705/g.36981  ORF Transcript_28705/g.36981 Transcript_28705/m.36981 type:complete len:131 (-) Transcript_28705:40-432(-)